MQIIETCLLSTLEYDLVVLSTADEAAFNWLNETVARALAK